MPVSDPLQILLVHDAWATTQLLHACAALTPDQFHHRYDIGPGSLHDTITHMIAAMRAWTDTLAEVEPRARVDMDGQRRTPQQQLAVHGGAAHEFAAQVDRPSVEEVVTATRRAGRTVTMAVGAVATEVTTHGTHLRAQCLNM